MIAVGPVVTGGDPQAGSLWELTLTTVSELLYRGWLHEAEFTSVGSGVCQGLHLRVPLVELIRSCSDVVWSQPLDVLVLRPLGRNSGANCGCAQATCHMPHGNPWLVVACAGNGFSREGQAMHQGWLTPEPSLGQVSEKAKAPQDLPLPSGFFLDLVYLAFDWLVSGSLDYQ